MYRWIWDRMPFGVPGKLFGMLLLFGGIGGLLWYLLFPAIDPLLPFNDVQVTAPHGGPTADTVVPPSAPASPNLPR